MSTGNVVKVDNEWLAPFFKGKRQMMIPGKIINVLVNEENRPYTIHNGKKCYLKVEKGFIDIDEKPVMLSVVPNLNYLNFEKRKLSSFKNMIDKQKYLINLKIKELQKSGVIIDYF